MSALRQAIRSKLTPQQDAAVVQRYSRFGNPEQARAAYDRRQQRQQQFGISNLNDANAQQIRRAAEAGLIGAQGAPGVYGTPGQPAAPAGPGDMGNAFGQGGPKFGPMTGSQIPMGPGPGGSPTPGRPIAPPAMAGAPQGMAVPPPSGGGGQFTPQSALGQAMMASFAIPPNKRKSFGRIG